MVYMDLSAPFTDYEGDMLVESVARLEQELRAANAQVDYLTESYSDVARSMLAADNVGWLPLVSGYNANSPTLAMAKEVATRLGDLCESNPLLRNGRSIRNSYLFSTGYKIGTATSDTTLSAQQQNIIKSSKNQREVFGLGALESIEGERYVAGNVFVLYDGKKKEFQRIPIDQIGDVIWNPDDSSDVWYVMRDWSAQVITSSGELVEQNWKMWYPVSDYTPGGGYHRRIKGIEVDPSKKMIIDRVNMRPGATIGVPDSLAAAPYALAYSAYLRDGTKVLQALAEWAWVVRPRKADHAQRAAAAIKSSDHNAGGKLITDMEVQALPKGNAVDLNTGRPLAAQVAAALGISVVTLLSDPGQSGAYGVAQTLSDPNRRTMEARRERNTEFLSACLRAMGVKDPAIEWGKMAPGSDAEEMQLTVQGWGTGLLHPDEARTRILDIAHISAAHTAAPDGVMLPNNESSMGRSDVDMDGTTGQTNGVGRDNVGLGALSRAKTTTKTTDSATAPNA